MRVLRVSKAAKLFNNLRNIKDLAARNPAYPQAWVGSWAPNGTTCLPRRVIPAPEKTSYFNPSRTAPARSEFKDAYSCLPAC